MKEPQPIRTCRHCGREVRGRSDKKFCDDACRNGYHNEQKAGDPPFLRKVNSSLRRNRSILEGLLPPGRSAVRVREEALTGAGFRFRYFTHHIRDRKGRQYRCCYEYGYRQGTGKWVTLVRGKAPVEGS